MTYQSDPPQAASPFSARPTGHDDRRLYRACRAAETLLDRIRRLQEHRRAGEASAARDVRGIVDLDAAELLAAAREVERALGPMVGLWNRDRRRAPADRRYISRRYVTAPGYSETQQGAEANLD